MPLGAARITLLAFSPTVAAVAEVIRKKVGVIAAGAIIDTTVSKFGGGSLDLSTGSARYLNVPHDSQIVLGNYDNWTIECWARFTEPTSRTLFNKDGIAGSAYPGYTIFTNASKQPVFGVGGSAGNWKTITGSALSNNTWYHFAAVKNGSTITFYQDGVSLGTNTYVGYNDQSRPLYIGWESNGAYMYGYVDEFRISNTARYTSGFTPSTTPFINDENTLLLLHMDGADASNVFEDDNGVRAKKGVVAVGNAQIDTAQSKFGGASALFDGNDKLTVSPMTPVTGDFTIEFWVRFNTAPGAYSNTNWQMAWTKNSNTYFLLWSNYIQVAVDGKYGAFNLGSTMTTGNWYHLALVRTSSDYKVYFNGTDTGSATDNGNWSTRNGSFDFFGSGSNLIGDYTTSKGINGWLDEVRISNTARYTANFTSPTAPFVNDENTLLLLHMDGTDTSTDFRDDNGVRSKVGITAIGNAQIDTAQSKFGGSSAIIASVGDYMNIGNPKQFDFTSDYTVECWINLASKSSGTKEIITIKDAGTLRGVLQFGSNNNYGFNWYIPGFRVFDGNTGGIGYAETNTGQWYHLAFTRSGNAFAFFINGTICESAAGTPTQTHDSVTIGSAAGSGYISPDYHIDEVRISNTARYTSGFTPSTTPFQNDSNTLLLLHMDGTDGSTTFIDDNGVPPDYDYGA